MKQKPTICLDCQSRTCGHLRGSFLSPREIEAVRLVGEGLSNKEIAHRMGLKYGTVKVYLCDRIFPKLKASNRVEVARYALQNAELLRGPVASDVYQFPVGV